MRKMNNEQRKEIEMLVYKIMMGATSSEYARHILEKEDGWTEISIMQDIIENVMETSAWNDEGYYSEDDIRLAIGRVIMERLEIEV